MGARRPDELCQLFATHARAGDIDGIMSLYEPGAVSPDDAGNNRTGAGLRASMKPWVDTKPDLVCDPRKVIQAGDLALVHVYSHVRGSDAIGHAVEVTRRQPDGSWLYVIDDPFADREANR